MLCKAVCLKRCSSRRIRCCFHDLSWLAQSRGRTDSTCLFTEEAQRLETTGERTMQEQLKGFWSSVFAIALATGLAVVSFASLASAQEKVIRFGASLSLTGKMSNE